MVHHIRILYNILYSFNWFGRLSVFRRVRNIGKSDYALHHACPSVRMEKLASHWTDFLEIYVYFRKYVEKIQVSF